MDNPLAGWLSIMSARAITQTKKRGWWTSIQLFSADLIHVYADYEIGDTDICLQIVGSCQTGVQSE